MLRDRWVTSRPELPEPVKFYVGIMVFVTLVTFAATLFIPYYYDQRNLQQFTSAEQNGNIIIREFISLFDSENLTQKGIKEKVEFLKNKKLISLDYLHQMNAARNIDKLRFFMFALAVALGLCLTTGLVLNFAKRYIYRTPILVVIFMSSLISMQSFGLPHTNAKFYIIVGFAYSLLIVLSDFLYTLTLDLNSGRVDPSHAGWNGYLSSLQYKHRFWTVIFNIFALLLLSLVATISFKVTDIFLVVFGEQFVQYPLIGLLLALGISLLAVLIGVVRPVRAHIVSIENAMRPELEEETQ